MYIEELEQKISTYIPLNAEQQQQLYNAYIIATQAHEGFRRVTGDPYLSHAMAVASILADWHAPLPIIITALLHDIRKLEYSSVYDLSKVEWLLGREIMPLLKAAIAINNLFSTIEGNFLRSSEVGSIGQDIITLFKQQHDILIIKIADRIHNLQTIKPLTRDVQENVARVGFNILVPLTEKLGMFAIKNQIEDACFEISHPLSYKTLKRSHTQIKQTLLDQILCDLQSTNSQVSTAIWSPRSLYTLYRRQIEYNARLGKPINSELSPRQLEDLGMFILLVPDEGDCYRTLGSLHAHYQPIERKFRDFIGAHKENGYRAIHTQVRHSSGQLLTISIRTQAMHTVAERGITARWWGVSEELLPTFSQQVLPDTNEIQVLTSTGEIKNIPVEATVLDFAYEIHTDIGHHCIGGFVNGIHAPLDQCLKMGDRIEIIKGGPETHPRLEYLDFVKTPQAANRIRHWFTINRRPEMIQRGGDLLDKHLRSNGLDISDSDLRELLTHLAFREQSKNWEDLLISISVGRHSPAKIVAQLRSAIAKQPLQNMIVHALSPHEDTFPKVYARCCLPIIPDDIIGCIDFRAHEQVLTIHRSDCAEFQKTGETIIPVKWDQPAEPNYMVAIEALDRKGLFADLARVVTLLECNIQDFKATSRPDGTMADAQILLGKTTINQRIHMQEELLKIPYVTHVELMLSAQLSAPIQLQVTPKIVHKANPYGPKLALGPRFYGREQECQRIMSLLRDQTQNTVILLWGQKRIGKSSLLLHLHEQPVENFIPVFVDVQNVSDATTGLFLRHLMVRIIDVFKEQSPQLVSDLTVPHIRKFRKDPLTLFDAFFSIIQERFHDTHMVLILDEFQYLWNLQETEVTLDAIFSRLRSTSQHGKSVHLILSGGGLLKQLKQQTTIAPLFNIAFDIKLDCLDLNAASLLIRDGMSKVGSITDDAVEYLLSITAGHPFYLQLLCWRLYDLAQERERTITLEDTITFIDDWLSTADSSRFLHLWGADSERAEQRNKVILSAIAELGCHNCQVEFNKLASLVQTVIAEKDLVHALEDLTSLGILKHNTMRYAIVVELFARWLRQHWPFELVLKEATLI